MRSAVTRTRTIVDACCHVPPLAVEKRRAISVAHKWSWEWILAGPPTRWTVVPIQGSRTCLGRARALPRRDHRWRPICAQGAEVVFLHERQNVVDPSTWLFSAISQVWVAHPIPSPATGRKMAMSFMMREERRPNLL